MSKNTKSILIGIVIGVIVLGVGQYAWSKYQASKARADMSAFNTGYNQAKDKKAYTTAYLASKPAPSKGVSVGLSNSSASTGGGYCQEIGDYINSLRDYLDSYPSFESGVDTTNWDIAWDYLSTATGYKADAGCYQ